MKNTLKKMARMVVHSNVGWKLAQTLIIKPAKSLEKQKQHPSKEELQKIKQIFSNKTVRNGPFKGLKYPGLSSVLSVIWPKLLGSYERELYPIIEAACERKVHKTIIDVGCAEGYFAVGLAYRLPEAKVVAYDLDARARKLCGDMASLNNVQNITIENFCTPEILAKYDFRDRALIISDCEGYEKILFDKQNIDNLGNCDIIIELHDYLDNSISDYITDLFSATHEINLIKSIDDYQKLRTYQYDELDGFTNRNTKKFMVAENRPGIMEWAFITPKADPLKY